VGRCGRREAVDRRKEEKHLKIGGGKRIIRSEIEVNEKERELIK
jgi:hypothetical protein